MPVNVLPDASVRYADHEDAVVDLHLPEAAGEGETGPLVVLLHGGFWKAEYDRRHTRDLARALADAGWLVATPEYRRVGLGGGWPVTAEDVHLAVTRLPEQLAALGLETGSESGPISVIGHSAGGQLALWLGTTGVPVGRVVALAPVCDLREARRLGLGGGATRAFLNGADSAEADPMVFLTRRRWPEVVVVHGVDDQDVPVSLSRGLVAAHPWIRLVELPATGHMELVDPTSSAWPTVFAALAGDSTRAS